MKIFPYATTDGIIQTVELAELEKLRAELAETKKYLAEANKGARVNAHINQSLAGKVNTWQLTAEKLATALTFWDVNNPALAAYEFATEGSPQMFTPCESCEATLVCSDLGNCYAEKGNLSDLLAEAVKRMEAVPCPPSAFTNTQWAFAKKKFISAAYEAAKSGDLPDPPLLEYRGKMYMRPCDRGAVLCDIDKQFDNDVLPEGDFVCEIRVWKGEQP